MSDGASVGTAGEAAGEVVASDPTKVLVTQHGREKVITLLRALSQRGKLPGFEQVDGGFRVRAYGDPFDYWLTGMVSDEGGGSRIAFELKVAPKMPLVFLIVAILTVQPGMWLTHSMLSTYFPWYGANVQTWWWYVPTCVLPLPWMLWRMWNKSKAAAEVHAAEQHEKIAAVVDGKG
jgi:hypothetical protein